MTKAGKDPIAIDAYLGCFGEFKIKDPICRKHCALRLRCAVEHDQNIRLELLEDLVSYEEMNTTIQ